MRILTSVHRRVFVTYASACSFMVSGCIDVDENDDVVDIVSQSSMAEHFVTTWTGTDIGIPTGSEGHFEYDVDWNNDGQFDEFAISGPVTHSFSDEGPHTIRIRGELPSIVFDDSVYADRIQSIDQWGTIGWNSMRAAFRGCSRLVNAATDVPDLSQVTDASMMFERASMFNADLSRWDVSNIRDMSHMFDRAASFNGNIDAWDVRNVEDMSHMFAWAESFDGDISQWDVRAVTNMEGMFQRASAFNGDISDWKTSAVTNMRSMFGGAESFNHDIGAWDVSAVTNMESMFGGASSFNQDLNEWNVRGVTTMKSMFSAAIRFNGRIDQWDVENVTSMAYMFYDARTFARDLSVWNVSNVTSFEFTFGGAASFDSNVENWNVANATTMYRMFYDARAFNQSLARWDVQNVSDMYHMLSNTAVTVVNFDATLEGWSKLANPQSRVTLRSDGLRFCTSGPARNHMRKSFRWRFEGDSESCCGNGAIDPGELCDDGAKGGCTNDCLAFTTRCYPDADGDGFGNRLAAPVIHVGSAPDTCEATHALRNDDCDDEIDGCGAGCFPGNTNADICDGFDQDCDDDIDEDYPQTATSCGVGACASTGTQTCVDGAEVDSCIIGPSASDDATCDGVDDDCDGESDEDFAISASTCGTGSCMQFGTVSCSNGIASDSCVPGLPLALDDVCDGLDEDCDGEADEDAICEAACDESSPDVDNDGTPDCADTCLDVDQDNFGVGDGCTGEDCDDDDPSCFTDCSSRAPGFGCIDEQICNGELSGSDSDDDGLPDFYEDLLCVETTNALTDEDTLNDFEELCDFGTNPCVADTDEDGFNDDVEIDAGSDPLDRNSVPQTDVTEAGVSTADNGCATGPTPRAAAPIGGIALILGLLLRPRRRDH